MCHFWGSENRKREPGKEWGMGDESSSSGFELSGGEVVGLGGVTCETALVTCK